MTFRVDIQNDAGYPLDEESLRRAALAVLEQHDADSGSALTVVIEDDVAVAALNQRYRGIDAPTDVLSFPAGPLQIPDEPPYLGDLVIAYPYAAAQSEREGHALHHSLALLVVHGTLHLLGYGHEDDARRAAMWQAQEAALQALGIPLAIAPALEADLHG